MKISHSVSPNPPCSHPPPSFEPLTELHPGPLSYSLTSSYRFYLFLALSITFIWKCALLYVLCRYHQRTPKEIRPRTLRIFSADADWNLLISVADIFSRHRWIGANNCCGYKIRFSIGCLCLLLQKLVRTASWNLTKWPLEPMQLLWPYVEHHNGTAFSVILDLMYILHTWIWVHYDT